MTDSTHSSSTAGTSNGADQYAQQWIDFLRKRNSMLSLLLLLMVVFSLFMGMAAFYFHQQGQTAILENHLAQENKSKLEAKISDQEKLLSESNYSFTDIRSEYEKLEAQLKSQTDQLSEAAETISVNHEIIDNLNSQLALLKEENEKLDGSLKQVRESLLSGASNSEILASENKNLTEEVSALNQKLKDRKIAYLAVVKRQKESRSEMDRLADSKDKFEQQASSYSQKAASLQKQLTELTKTNASLQANLNKAKDEYKTLEVKLNSVMAPVGPASIVKTEGIKQESSDKAIALPSSGDGLEEIKIQKPRIIATNNKTNKDEGSSGSEKQNSAQSFDFNKISVH